MIHPPLYFMTQLQQQGLQRSNGENRSAVNMNFIRLTWQQMLGAVHCIHEERIIHGDLKVSLEVLSLLNV